MTRTTRILLLGLGALVIWAMPAMAFHDEGVAHCDGCHTMHNSVDGVAVAFQADGVTKWPVGQGNDYLLLYASVTDVCLSCHENAGSVGRGVWDASNDCTSAYEERGGGDFSCQVAVDIQDGFGPVVDGSASGHTLITTIGGRLTADDILTEAPGGNYPAASLRCTSCHDPHGTGNFRLLYGAGQVTADPVVSWTTTLDAIGISLSTRGANLPELDTNHNVYQANYAEWCSTCHTLMHNNSENIHPAGEVLTAAVRGIYNGYTGSTACVGVPCPIGADNTPGAFLALVPFEDPLQTLVTDTDGPGPGSRVACMSCHRAHGTSAENAGRWDFTVTGLIEDGVRSGTFALPNPYDPGQRSLCNKCHGQDEYDAVFVP